MYRRSKQRRDAREVGEYGPSKIGGARLNCVDVVHASRGKALNGKCSVPLHRLHSQSSSLSRYNQHSAYNNGGLYACVVGSESRAYVGAV
jgi:hypothetical protein